ncbi:unnamed protein product [Oppiella nova]|uniref:ZP domain-containing protein n=1 Tax=Oppiella nova TaxID=334625 RepID=A0A7R9QF74_9ACAR|nr:unnamed protein product [Oppiella nova]CAG2163801.1 unnamed protein product [Oppiella nova]
MEIRRGFGIAGTRTSGPVTVGDPLTLLIHMKSEKRPVTVGDPLTLLIHMKSEKTGFDILVKNCVAHNGAQQRLQLIDSSGCVTNEKLISPFRGTYNSENGHQVSLYSYLKAFRFTGSPALYLECDIHMCHNKCPPQRCYWRNLSKRSIDSQLNTTTDKPLVSESISLFQSLEVRQESDQKDIANNTSEFNSDVERSNVCFRSDGVAAVIISIFVLLVMSFSMSIGCCMKMRRMKYCQRHMIDASSLYKSSYDTIYSYPHSDSTLHSRRF